MCRRHEEDVDHNLQIVPLPVPYFQHTTAAPRIMVETMTSRRLKKLGTKRKKEFKDPNIFNGE